MRVWVTKYALSTGIFSADARQVSPTMVAYKHGGFSADSYAHGNDWHLSEEKAIARAEEMRKKRVASMEKSLKTIKALDFSQTKAAA